MKEQTTIQTVANNVKHNDAVIMEERIIETAMPECLLCESLDELRGVLGEDADKIILSKTLGQLTIDFRSGVRNRLSSVNKETGELSYGDEQVQEYAEEWAPTLRVAKSKEEKALEMLNGLDPEQLAKVLSQAGTEA